MSWLVSLQMVINFKVWRKLSGSSSCRNSRWAVSNRWHASRSGIWPNVQLWQFSLLSDAGTFVHRGLVCSFLWGMDWINILRRWKLTSQSRDGLRHRAQELRGVYMDRARGAGMMFSIKLFPSAGQIFIHLWHHFALRHDSTNWRQRRSPSSASLQRLEPQQREAALPNHTELKSQMSVQSGAPWMFTPRDHKRKKS